MAHNADRIARTSVVDGVATPAFIHNGGYFFINLEVYADGLVDCWELVDLAIFKDKLASGWVVTAVPNGASMSVHGLAAWEVSGGEWLLGPKTGLLRNGHDLYDRVEALVRTLNPRMENLHDCHGRTVEVVKGVRYATLGMSRSCPVQIDNPEIPLRRYIKGDQLSVLRVLDVGRRYLADLRVFPDGTIELGRLPAPEEFPVDELAERMKEGSVTTSVPAGARVEIHQLGHFQVARELYATDPQDLLAEVRDIVEQLNGRPDSLKRCRKAFDDYLASPTESARAALQEAYEQVPDHNRRYLGDMDVRDIPIRMVIYGEQELENWSHRLVARHMKLAELPIITVPKPKG